MLASRRSSISAVLPVLLSQLDLLYCFMREQYDMDAVLNPSFTRKIRSPTVIIHL